MSFRELNLSPALCRTVETCGYTTPTPVQAQSIPVILAGNDLRAAAQTGTGKTAAFALPILQRLGTERNARALAGRPRVLVLTPTRELAMQVQESFRRYGKESPVRSLAVFGGAGMVPQTQALRRGVEIVVATPGRLLDHMGQGNVSLAKVEILVLDEADRMLDMGFLPDLERILATLPEQRQSLLFSATFPEEIRDLAARLLRNPVEVQVARPNSAAPQVSHSLHLVEREEKKDLLVDMLSTGTDRQALVFCRTRHGSDRLCRQLLQAGFAAAAIHGDKSQTARTRALGEFKSGRTSVLVATDVAARGLDIRQLPLVVNYDLPQVPEDYIHRIGRTGRAGDDGRAVSLVSRSERDLLRGIERLLDRRIDVAERPKRVAGAATTLNNALDFVAVGPNPGPSRSSQPAAPQRSSRSSQPRRAAERIIEPRRSHGSSEPRRSDRSVEPRRPTQSSEPRRSHGSSEPRRSDRSVEPRRSNQSSEPRRSDRSGQPRRTEWSGERRGASPNRPSNGRRERHAGESARGERSAAASTRDSNRSTRPAQSDRRPRKVEPPVTVRADSSKGRPFWWPFAGKRRPDEVAGARAGAKRSARPRRDYWPPTDSGDQA